MNKAAERLRGDSTEINMFYFPVLNCSDNALGDARRAFCDAGDVRVVSTRVNFDDFGLMRNRYGVVSQSAQEASDGREKQR